MGVKASVVKVDVRGVRNKVNRIKNNQALGMFATLEAARLMQPFVPEREGVLKSSVLHSEPWKVVYSTPYAVYQYNGVSKGGKKLHYSKPTATSRWDKNLTGARLSSLAQAITGKIKGL